MIPRGRRRSAERSVIISKKRQVEKLHVHDPIGALVLLNVQERKSKVFHPSLANRDTSLHKKTLSKLMALKERKLLKSYQRKSYKQTNELYNMLVYFGFMKTE